MSTQKSFISIPNLGRLDQLELAKLLSADELKFERGPDGDDDHGELATVTAVVIVSLAALKVLAIYIAKRRQRTVIRRQNATVGTDGTRHESVFEYTFEAEASEAEVIKVLGEATNVDAKALMGQ